MSPPHASTRRRRDALAALSMAVVLAATVSGCSATGDPRDGAPRHRSVSPVVAGTPVEVETTVSHVHGDLAAPRRRALERDAGRVLSRYVSAAYLGERSTAGHRGSFPGFTRDARRLALREVATTADQDLAWADEVRPIRASAHLSVVSQGGRPVGVTARVLLRLAASDERRAREVAVRGRLLLTPAGDRWRIFGYDLSVGSTAVKRAR